MHKNQYEEPFSRIDVNLRAEVSGSDDDDDEDKRTLFIANIDDRVTEDLLYELFLQAGPIESVRIPRDNTGRQRTFGFITFTHKCSLPYAMQLLSGLQLYRKTIVIKPQGNSNAPTQQQQQQRRPYPPDIHPIVNRSNDNIALQFGAAAAFSGYNDIGFKQQDNCNLPLSSSSMLTHERHEHQMRGGGGGGGGANAKDSDWTKGNYERSRHAKDIVSNKKHTSTPYYRDSGNHRSSGGSSSSSIDNNKGNHNTQRHKTNDRRSEQRNKRHR